MRIGPISSHHLPADLDSLYRSTEPQADDGNRLINPEEQRKLLAVIQHNPTLTQILSDYDVTDIMIEEFSEMSDRLESESLISSDSHELLAGVRSDLARFQIGSDESVDLFEFYKTLVERLVNPEGAEPLPLLSDQPFGRAAVESRLQWMEKFATLQNTPRAMGINARA